MDTQDKFSQNKPTTKQKRNQERRLNVGVGHKNPPSNPEDFEKTKEDANIQSKKL